MDEIAAAAITGILPLLFMPQLPGRLIWWLAMVLACGLWISRQKVYRLFALVIVSFLWATWNADTLIGQISDLASSNLTVIAVMKSVNFNIDETQNVVLKVSKIGDRWIFPPIAISAKWDPNLRPFCAGQRWQLGIRSRPVHGRLNQGGFDSQRWAVANRQPLIGKIVTANLIDSRCTLRQEVISYIDHQLNRFGYRPILLGLAFGERKLIEKSDKAVLQRTGTAHLMAISGLHISMSALFGWLLARGLQFFFPSSWIEHRFPLLLGWLIAMIYVWLAGSNPPAVRAALALTLWMILRSFCVLCSSWQVWLWGISLILLSDPLAVLSDSFWLSCLAVAALIFWFEWVPLPQRFQFGWYWGPLRWLHLQFGMMLLLMPMQVGLFHGLSLTSLPANLWAVPIVSLFTVPVVLLALVLSMMPVLASFFWYLADFSLMLVFIALNELKKGWLNVGETSILISYSGWVAVIIWRFHWWRHYPVSMMVLCVTVLILSRRGEDYRW